MAVYSVALILCCILVSLIVAQVQRTYRYINSGWNELGEKLQVRIRAHLLYDKPVCEKYADNGFSSFCVYA